MRLILPIAGLLIATAAGCLWHGRSAPAVAPLRRVEVLVATAEPAADTYELVGQIVPWREATLYFEVPGVVADVAVEEGHVVSAGDEIAKLVDDDFRLERQQAEAQFVAAQARWDLLKAGTRAEQIEAARAELAGAETAIRYWKGEHDRRKTVFERGAGTISQSDLDQALFQLDSSTQTGRGAQAKLDEALAGPRPQERLAAEQEAVARGEALALTDRRLQKTRLTAPFAGRIERRLLDPGAYVNVFPQGGVPIAHLVDMTQADVVLAVPERLLPKAALVERLTVRSALVRELSAEADLVALSQLAERAAGTYELRLRFDNAAGRFAAGMIVTAALPTESLPAVIRVPYGAVRRPYGEPPQVLVVDPADGRVSARDVQLGPVEGELVRVVTGLSEGEWIVGRGGHEVLPGDRVEAVEARRESPTEAISP